MNKLIITVALLAGVSTANAQTLDANGFPIPQAHAPGAPVNSWQQQQIENGTMQPQQLFQPYIPAAPNYHQRAWCANYPYNC